MQDQKTANLLPIYNTSTTENVLSKSYKYVH